MAAPRERRGVMKSAVGRRGLCFLLEVLDGIDLLDFLDFQDSLDYLVGKGMDKF
jgi:hypothetical protein